MQSIPLDSTLGGSGTRYFSALERLRFAQESDEVDRIYNHYDLSSVNLKHRKHRQALSSPDTLWATPGAKCRDSYFTAVSDDSWVLSYPDKVNKAELTREEQVSLVKHLRASVILDAASVAIARAHHVNSNEANRLPTPDIDHSTATLSSRTGSPDSMLTSAMTSNQDASGGAGGAGGAGADVDKKDGVRESLYDSIRWLDEDGALDLGLALDDYHANLREEIAQNGKNSRPSFRRRLSISKRSFGRTSLSGRPDTKVPPSPMRTHSLEQQQEQPQHISNTQRRLSRTLSVMNPSRHAHSGSTSIIDPSATHYQDPEARQKLRAYLSSPTKFDEAVQFGFPATDSQQQMSTTTSDRKRQSRQRLSPAASSENMRSFLYFDGDEDDEDLSDDNDDDDDVSSVSDPESPRTPQMGGLMPPPGHHPPTRTSTDPLHLDSGHHRRVPTVVSKPMTSDSHAPSSLASREMTMRMTLTRPDLRANEELIYGWRNQATQSAYIAPGRRSQSAQLTRNDVAIVNGQTTTACWSSQGAAGDESNAEKMWAVVDHWNTETAAGDQNVVKRFWNKVKRT
ncbi:hypothetical protein M406DRAFT_350128 [Cryphonectria parasitica EP155]|uniref:Uncharacterized protein n=1 Tax=Cryphonectria parasitica (strain ATCC 38755 / EP155) TaxID=660469 RepID=A0A9P5CTC2_CRYP1|nr:uncharacterized protein M406DRAFT_350128 [Cryphonectria parasitica EP155]KAF3769266.1 hypothetical protein M406DRAFT_350128 [Cryphonectria parasitica EP155]